MKEISICESCANNTKIRFHTKKGKSTKRGKSNLQVLGCFYDFHVWTEGMNYTHVAHVIVEECSFYNTSALLIKKKKQEIDDDDDIREESKRGGVTFVNIPGALLP